MHHDSYASLNDALRAVRLSGQQSRPDQLVVSAQRGPVWPERGNSFWLSFLSGRWYLTTWLPACYRIPSDQDMLLQCVQRAWTSARQRCIESLTRLLHVSVWSGFLTMSLSVYFQSDDERA
jgi:hypothetical protein